MIRGLIGGLAERMPAPDLAPRSRLLWESRQEALRAAQEAKLEEEIESVRDDAASGTITTRDFVRLGGSGVTLSLQDQWSVFGAKGSGKTTLELQLIDGLRKVFPQAGVNILDSKPDAKLAHFRPRIETAEPPPPAGPGQLAVWAPLDNDVDAYDAWFESIVKDHAKEPDDRPSLTVVDELSSIGGKSGMSFPLGFLHLMKQGRSNKKCLITLSQDAAFIPRQVTGQATHLIRMHLNTESDCAKLDTLIHGTAKPRRDPATRHGFWYKCLDTPGSAQFFSDWKQLLT